MSSTISAQAVRPRAPGQWMDPERWAHGRRHRIAIAAGSPSQQGSALLLRRRLLRDDRVRHGDREPLRCSYIAVIGNNSAMNQIRYGQLAKYGDQRGNVGNLLGDVPFGKFCGNAGRLWRRGA